jgi:adenylate cyclase
MSADDPGILRNALQTLSVGVALADAEDWRIDFENARFFRWFPPTDSDDDTLGARMGDLKEERARARVADGRTYSFDTEVKDGPRSVSLKVEVRGVDLDGAAAVLVECHDVSKQKEAEYMLDSYSSMVERHTRELQRQKERVEKLLLNIMPRSVFEEMTEFGTVTPQRFDEVSILMLDFVGFTSMAISRDPSALIAELNDIFTAFDRIVELFGCERLKTIGDAYIAVSGLPDPTPDHAHNAARVALRMRRYLERRNRSHPEQWVARIGLHTGPVIGSMVGVQKYVYDIFGPGVNLAARMESISRPMAITISQAFYDQIADDFVTSDLGEVELKGFGTQRIHSLDSESK